MSWCLLAIVHSSDTSSDAESSKWVNSKWFQGQEKWLEEKNAVWISLWTCTLYFCYWDWWNQQTWSDSSSDWVLTKCSHWIIVRIFYSLHSYGVLVSPELFFNNQQHPQNKKFKQAVDKRHFCSMSVFQQNGKGNDHVAIVVVNRHCYWQIQAGSTAREEEEKKAHTSFHML